MVLCEPVQECIGTQYEKHIFIFVLHYDTCWITLSCWVIMLLLSTLDSVHRWSLVNPCDSCGAKMLGLFHKPKWIHNPNLVKMQFLLTLLLIIWSDHTFSRVTAGQLSVVALWKSMTRTEHFCTQKKTHIFSRCGLWAFKLFVKYICAFKALSAGIQNHAKIIFAVIMVIQSGHSKSW